MALYEFRLPDIGEGVAEGEVVAWHVAEGQLVAEDQEMVEVMTDKATVTIGAPKAGRIARLHAGVGEKVPVGSVLVAIDPEASAPGVGKAPAALGNGVAIHADSPRSESAQAAAPAYHSMRPGHSAPQPAQIAKDDEGPAASAVGDIRESLPGSTFFSSQAGSAPKVAPAATNPGGPAAFFAEKPLATPATRKLCRDAGVDLRRVPPTGEGGRVTREDVLAFSSIDTGQHVGQSAGQAPLAKAAPKAAQARAVGPTEVTHGLESRKPFVGLRRRIAERMRAAKQNAAHFTFVEEVEVDALKGVIDRLRPAADRQGVKLNYLPFIVKAVTLALKKHPILNSTLDEPSNELVYKGYYPIGIATATDQGLMVPVLRDADRLSPLDIAREIQRISEGARAGSLTSKELGGSTFTITSLGKQGGLLATPVLNHPEVGILGVHRVKERPVVRKGQIVVGQVMLLSLSFDHRIIDGHVGAAFAYDVIAYLENPDLLLLELA